MTAGGAAACLAAIACGGSAAGEAAPILRQAGLLTVELARPHTARSEPPVLIAAGDIARCDSDGDEATARLVGSLRGTVLTLGDHAYRDGSRAAFAACYDTSWGQHRARTRPTPGNHDYRVRNAAGYFEYFGAAAGPPGRGYYSFDVGDWHVISLNSNVNMRADSPQMRWLRADLLAHPGRCTLAYWHQPRFSSGKHGSSTRVAPLWQTAYDAGVDVVLQAHDHSYERFAPLDSDGRPDADRGIRSFVVGTGGAPLRGFPTIVPGSEVRHNTGHGVLKLSLRSDGYEWEFVATDGTVHDRGEGRCHEGRRP